MMKTITYKKWRSKLFWGAFFVGIASISWLIYRELTSPLSIPSPTNIVSNAPPQTEPPTAEARAEHRVPPTYPKNLIIPKIGINTNIYSVGLTKEGAIDSPQTAWAAGWYQDSTLPGSGSGAALIDGHVNDAFNTPGVFYELPSLVMGDEIVVIRGDDSTLHYKVVSTARHSIEGMDMNQVLRPINPGKEGLNLVTCGGKYDKATGTYSDRIIVYAVRA